MADYIKGAAFSGSYLPTGRKRLNVCLHAHTAKSSLQHMLLIFNEPSAVGFIEEMALLGAYCNQVALSVPARHHADTIAIICKNSIYHLILPILILLIVPVAFQTPLWVAEAFVPDVFIIVVLSTTLLFATGIVKTIMLINTEV